MRLLILGGYGVFGGRLAELLRDLPQLEMLICGRDANRAARFCAAFKGAAKVTPCRLDRNQLSERLEELAPDLIVDASGPFQHYGADPYAVIRTCIAAGVDYMDFADSADFVFGVRQFDDAAKAAGVSVLSGVSSFPVLTAAVLRNMSQNMEIRSVEGGIAPSPYAGIGLNVMRAVVGYAGEPVKLTRGGVQTTAPGLAESRRYTVAVPGRLPLRSIRFSLVDVPDLQVLPAEHPSLQNIWMGAGPVPEILHRILNLLAKLRAAIKLPSLVPRAGLFYRVLNLARFGEHRGGMYVRADGLRDGKPVSRSWHLLAEGDDGPYIPSMAIEALVRRRLQGQRPDPGARPATTALELADYDRLFAGRTIHTGFRDDGDSQAPLYRQILGDTFDTLPEQVRLLHDETGPRSWSGRAQVRRGTGLLARLVGRLMGFPAAGDDIPVRVEFSPRAGAELWTRTFGGKRFSSLQAAGHGRNARLLVESFGPIHVALALVIEGDRLFLIPRHWALWRLPLPKALLPKGASFETQLDGTFRFNVEIATPVVGLIVRYQGQLNRDQGAHRSRSDTMAVARPGHSG